MVMPLDRGRPSYRHLVAWGLVASLLVTGLYLYPPFLLAYLDQRVYDVLFRSAQRPQTSGRVVIVDLDERSLARFGRWPWPRGLLARLLEKIEALGAASVGIDMIFAEPDETPPSPGQQASTTLGSERKAGLTALTPNDAALAAVLSRGAFILGYNLLFGAEREDGRGCVLHPIPVVTLQRPGGRAEVAALFQASEVLCSLPGLAAAVAGSGFLNAAPDADGILRRMPLMIAHKGHVYPSLGLATLVPVLGIRQFVLQTTGGRIESLALEDIVVPLDPRGGLLLHFRGGKQTFPYISAADVLGDQLPKGSLRNRIVFLGTSAPGVGDSVATPLDTTFPGVEVHATVADSILRRDFIRRAPTAPAIELGLVAAAGPVAALMVAVAGIAWGGALLVAVAAGLWITTGWLMGSTGLFISPVFPVVALAFSFTAITLASFFLERGRADWTTRRFRQTRRIMLKKLRKRETDLRAAQERAKLGSWELDLARQTGSWSAEMFRLFNCDPARGAPTFAEFLEMVHPDDRHLIEEGLTRAVQTGNSVTQEFRSNPLRGPLQHFNAIVHPRKNAEGQVVHVGGTIQDITALIEAKRALDTAEREAILGRVAASVAHEINNPLLAIKTRLHTLKKTMADRPETTEKLDLVMGQLDRIDRATRSMLGFFKQRAAYSKLLSYAEVIRAATDLFDPSFAAKGVRVIVNLPHSLPGVSVSVDELQEVLINLLENERDALGRDNDLYVSAQTQDHQIVIRIEDNGPGLGLDPELLFKAFYTTKSTGTGLGLTIARRICESYGGKLTAENRKEGGARFEIILPLAASVRSDENLSGRR
jgi:CHASE2 domain-containing sensor protein/nitrogen-specific signal transduction histidine kinase